MALFHLSVTQTKRSAGQSAIASAAYRSGEKLYSEYYGEYSDYTRKGGVICSDILLPSHVPPEYADRQTLWNAVEKAERGKNAQLAFSMPSASEDNRQGYGSSGSLLPETVPPGISAGAWAFLPFPAVSSPHRKTRSPVPVVRRLLSFPAHTGRRQNQSHPHPHRSLCSVNADPASCLGFYRDGTGSKPSRSALQGFHNAPQPVWL